VVCKGDTDAQCCKVVYVIVHNIYAPTSKLELYYVGLGSYAIKNKNVLIFLYFITLLEFRKFLHYSEMYSNSLIRAKDKVICFLTYIHA
jgi:hypothetical protein